MDEARLPPATLEGWYLLHQIFRIDWSRVRDDEDAADRGREFAAVMASWEQLGEEGWSGAYRLAGGGADVLLLHFRQRLEDLTAAARRIARSRLGGLLSLASDYVSVVELGLYGLSLRVAREFAEVEDPDPDAWSAALEEALARQREVAFVRDRLYPERPDDKPYVSFYPMSKRRDPERNWYALPLSRREELMQEHGAVGRRYAGRISQVISGSIGLDDWEWAVTLFAGDPLDFKAVVTDMRYDEASAVYADFGPFYVGKRMPAADWATPESW